MENYHIIKKIGEGSFGNAYVVRHKETEKLSVMKEVDMKKVKIYANLFN